MLRKIELDEFKAVYTIMEKSFPDDEFRPYGEQYALLKNPNYTVLVPNENKTPITAFIATWELENYRFIEHFAVSPTLRGGGIGGTMLDEFIALSDKPVSLEVELPESELAARRIVFYERHGLTLSSHPYIQPAISAGRNPIPLRLMTTNGTLSEEQYILLRDELYRMVYNVK